MPATERYQTDVFAIIVVIASILVVVFLIVAAIYFNGIQNWTSIPGTSESIFLFWSAIVLGVIFLAIIIYGLYRIFTHRAVICPKLRSKPVTTEVVSAPTSKPIIPVSNKPTPAKVETIKPTSPTISPTQTVKSISTQAAYPSQVTKPISTQAVYPSQVTKPISSQAVYPSQTATITSYPSQVTTPQISTTTGPSSLERELLNLGSALED